MISECKHYKRNCDKQAPCCKIFYPCRLCHDNNYYNPGQCKVEQMDRYNVQIIRCRQCQTEQPVSNECINCKIQFASYFCPICKLWSDDENKKIIHCDKCKMCRIGTKETLIHCDICDVCWPIQSNHKCIQQAFEQNCAVCMEYLKNSTLPVQQLENCHHFIHVQCLNRVLKSGANRCPICNTAIVKMSKNDIEEYDKIVEQFQDKIPEELKDKKVSIMCLECQQKTNDIPFHFYLKCGHCGSYNTKE